MGQGKQLIQKASRPVRWQTDVLKHHLNLILSFFYISGDGDGARGCWGQEVMINLRHLDVGRDLSRVVRLLVLGWLTSAISLTCPWCSQKSLATQLSLLYILLYLFWGGDFQARGDCINLKSWAEFCLMINKPMRRAASRRGSFLTQKLSLQRRQVQYKGKKVKLF